MPQSCSYVKGDSFEGGIDGAGGNVVRRANERIRGQRLPQTGHDRLTPSTPSDRRHGALHRWRQVTGRKGRRGARGGSAAQAPQAPALVTRDYAVTPGSRLTRAE